MVLTWYPSFSLCWPQSRSTTSPILLSWRPRSNVRLCLRASASVKRRAGGRMAPSFLARPAAVPSSLACRCA